MFLCSRCSCSPLGNMYVLVRDSMVDSHPLWLHHQWSDQQGYAELLSHREQTELSIRLPRSWLCRSDSIDKIRVLPANEEQAIITGLLACTNCLAAFPSCSSCKRNPIPAFNYSSLRDQAGSNRAQNDQGGVIPTMVRSMDQLAIRDLHTCQHSEGYCPGFLWRCGTLECTHSISAELSAVCFATVSSYPNIWCADLPICRSIGIDQLYLTKGFLGGLSA